MRFRVQYSTELSAAEETFFYWLYYNEIYTQIDGWIDDVCTVMSERERDREREQPSTYSTYNTYST
jgi:hypothetical protein